MNDIRLEIKIDGEYKKLYVNEDTTISIEMPSPIWNEQGMFSQSFSIPIEPNRHVLGNVDDVRGHSIYKLLWGARFRLWVEGLLFQTGVVHLDSEIDINEGEIDIELVGANKEFDDLLSGVKANDVVVLDESKIPGHADYQPYSKDNQGGYVQIGSTLAEKDEFDIKLLIAHDEFRGDVHVYYVNTYIDTKLETYNPRLVFTGTGMPFGNYVNTTQGYPDAAYCNVQTCYQKYECTDSGNNTWEKSRGYSVGPASRVHSAPCFYVLYWLQLLMRNIDVHLDMTEILKEEDLRYLAFMNTKVGYKSGESIGDNVCSRVSSALMKECFNFSLSRKVNKSYQRDIAPINEKITINGTEHSLGGFIEYIGVEHPDKDFVPLDFTLYNAYATGDNFPSEDAMSIIEGLQNGFGMRYIFDSNVKSVRFIFVRDVLKQSAVTDLPCVVSDVYKRENHINGFRLKYSSSDSTSKQNAITKKDKEYTGQTDSGENTTYDYNDYRNVVRMKGLRSGNNDGEIMEYGELATNLWPYDAKAYYNSSNGELYRIKVDADAKSAATLFPSLFEVAGYHDVEVGDCSENDFVEEVSIGFAPLIPNDINYDNIKKIYGDTCEGEDLEIKSNFATFVNEEIHHLTDDSGNDITSEDVVDYDTAIAKYNTMVDGRIISKTYSTNISYKMEAVETWKLESGIDHPYDSVSPTFTLGILRQSMTGGGMNLYAKNYDGEGMEHSKVQYIPSGSGQFTSDSVDQYGKILCVHAGDGDENGEVSDGEVSTGISLKLQAEKPNPYWKEWKKKGSVGTYKYQEITNDTTGLFIIDEADNNHIGRRGLYDRFYREYAHWVVNRRIAVFTIPRGGIGLIQLMGIDFTKKYRIHGYSGFINKVNYNIDKDGLGDVEIEMYYL